MASGVSALTLEDYWTAYDHLNSLEKGMNSLSGSKLDKLYLCVEAFKKKVHGLEIDDGILKTKVSGLFARVADKTRRKDDCEMATLRHWSWVLSGGGY